MGDIENYIKTEEQKMTWLDKLVKNYPEARNTNSIAHTFKSNFSFLDQTTIRPSFWNRMISIIIVLFMGFIWIGLLNMVLAYKFPFVVNLFCLVLMTFLIFLVIRNSFFNKKYNYTLTIDKNGISVDKRQILWSDVADTFIMNRQEGKGTNYYLLILKTDKLDLKMGTSVGKLAAIIEHHKQKSGSSSNAPEIAK